MVITAKRQRRRKRTWEMVIALLPLATAAATSTAERIRSGQTSSFEEISRHLARAFRHEHDLRAYVSIFGAEALRAAAARDADTANGFSVSVGARRAREV